MKKTKVIVKANVAYPGQLLKMLDEQAEIREQNGEQGLFSGIDPLAPNAVCMIFDWDSVTSARQFWGSTIGIDQTTAWKARALEITIASSESE